MSKEQDILKLLTDEQGEIDFEEAVSVLGKCLVMMAQAGKKIEPIAKEVEVEVVEITDEQQSDLLAMQNEHPGIDREEYTLMEKLEREATVKQKKMDAKNDRSIMEPDFGDPEPKKKGNFRGKAKAVAVEEFADVRKLEDDEIF